MDCQTVRDDLHVEPTSVPVRTHLAGCPRCTIYAERMSRLDQMVRGELVTTVPATISVQLETLATAPAPQLSRLDAAARDELVIAAPKAVSARLLALVPAEPLEPARVAAPVDTVLREALVLQAPADLTARLQALVPRVAAPEPVSAAVPAPVVPARPRRWVVATVYAITSALLLLSLLYAGQVYTVVLTQLGLEQWLTQISELPAAVLTQLYTYVPQSRVVIGVLVSLRQPLQWLLVALVLWAVIDMSQRQRQSYAEGKRQYA